MYTLKSISYEECKKLIFPDYQRNQTKGHINGILRAFESSGVYSALPITINEKNEVIDGGHRLKAFIKGYESGTVVGDVQAICINGADKKSFLEMNKGKSVSINHKIKIHEKVKKLVKNGIRMCDNKSNNSALAYSDFARALFVYFYDRRLKQVGQKDIFKMLDDCSFDLMLKYTHKIIAIKDMYFDNLTIDKKFIQKYLIYFCYLDKHKLLKRNDIARMVPKLPNSLGGDIGLPYNQQIFLDAYNYNKKTNRLDISIFSQKG